MTPALATYTGTVHEARVYAPKYVTYVPFKPEGDVVLVPAIQVDEDRTFLAIVRAQLSRLWATEWDSDEDSVYDQW
jgi:hypothetical protein